jgi:parallel beta-helix repeat protein
MAEDAYQGDAQFTISVDGVQIGGTQTTTALRSAGATQLFNVAGTFAAGTHIAAINFLNDAYGGTASTDRNLFLIQASIDGATIAGAALALVSAGTQSFSFQAPGPASVTPPPPTNLGSGPDVIALTVNEDAYQGNAQFTISVDGTQIDGTQTATALRSAGITQQFNLAGGFGTGTHTVTVNFLNDAYGGTASTDRNLFVTQASLNGAAISGASLSLFSSGAQSFSFQGPGTSPPPTGSDTLVLGVSEDAYQGDAQFTVSVDGTQVGGIRTATALHSSGATNQLTLNGSWGAGAHTVVVTFINDAYGGTATTDRNLYVNSIAYNGTAVAGTPVALTSNGSTSFAVPAAGTTPPPPTTGPGFYVAVGGSDTADGSFAHPFASISRAVTAMETSSTLHTTYVEGGNYGLTSTVSLSGADSSFTITGYNGQRPVLFDANNNLSSLMNLNGTSGVNISGLSFHAAGRGGLQLNGGSGNSIVGNQVKDAGTAVLLNGSSGNTLSGNEIDNSGLIAVELKDGANGNLVDSNLMNGVGGTSTHGGGIYAHGVSNNRISHNLIENTGGSGITFVNFDDTATINVGNTVDYNTVLNTGYATGYDSGSIYVLGRANADTKMTINNNYIDRTGAGGDAHTIAIYLDDSVNGVSVTNNIARNVGTHGLQIHGGHNNSVINNILDLDLTTNSAGFFQALSNDPAFIAQMYNNVVQRNIIYAHKPSQTAWENLYGGSPTISNNLYFGVNGGQITMNGGVADTNPKFGDPRFQDEANGNYTLLSGSAASQISFNPIDQSGIGVHPTGAHWY